MKKKIFILNGMGGSGKDTFVKMVAKYIPTRHISIADRAKALAHCVGWNGTKTPKDRKFLYDLKHLVDEYNDSNYADIVEQVKIFNKDPFTQFLFIDMREINQIKRACKDFNAISVLVKRNNAEKITNNPADAQTLDKNYKYDFVIENNTTLEHLNKLARQFVKGLIGDKPSIEIKLDAETLQTLTSLFDGVLNDKDLKVLIKEFEDLFK